MKNVRLILGITILSSGSVPPLNLLEGRQAVLNRVMIKTKTGDKALLILRFYQLCVNELLNLC